MYRGTEYRVDFVPKVKIEVVVDDGKAQTADDLAAALGTLNYEIVTAISRRVPRRYRRGGKVVAHRTVLDGYVKQ